MLITNLTLKEMKVPELWKLETIGITDSGHILSKVGEGLTHDHFMKEVSQNEKGHYSVGLPWIDSKQDILSNRYIAERRLISTMQILKSLKKFENYE